MKYTVQAAITLRDIEANSPHQAVTEFKQFLDTLRRDGPIFVNVTTEDGSTICLNAIGGLEVVK